ncbi:MAG: hypothetical protein FGM46_06345 [Ferruginibacter sp.]|nr:hypothetical protein [Ferruginibacter sp.]
MKLKQLTYFVICLLVFNSLVGCKNQSIVYCEQSNLALTVTKTDVTSLPGNGVIIAKATGGSRFSYSIEIASNSTGEFKGLPPGIYTVTVINDLGCTKSDVVNIETNIPGNRCTENNIVISCTPTPSTPCSAPTGTILVGATGSTDFVYSINGGTYQSSNIFNSLAPGNYIIGVKDINRCTKIQEVTVPATDPGTNFANVKNIIKANCSSCHLNGKNSGGINYDNECNIITGWSKINQACVVRSTMPPSNPLPANAKEQISAWIKAGHRYSD